MKCSLRWVVNYIRFPVEQFFSLSLREEEFVYILSREGGLYFIIIFSCLRFVWVTVWPPLFVDKAIKWLNKQKLLYRADFLLFSFLIRLNTPFSYSADHSVSFFYFSLFIFIFFWWLPHYNIVLLYAQLWDIRRKGCIFTYKGHSSTVNSLRFSPDGQWIASTGDDGYVKVRSSFLFREIILW